MLSQPLYGSQVQIPASMDLIDNLFAEFALFMEELNLAQETQNEWKVVFLEATTNSILHGSNNDPNKKIEVCWSLRGKELWLEISDTGTGPKEIKTKGNTLPKNPLEPYGRGFFLIEQFSNQWQHWKGPYGYRQIIIRNHPGVERQYRVPENALMEATLEELSQSYESLTAFYQLGESLVNAESICKFVEQARLNLSQLIETDKIKLSFVDTLQAPLRKELENLKAYSRVPKGKKSKQEMVLSGSEEYIWENVEEIRGEPELEKYSYGIICPIRAGTKCLGILTLARQSNNHYFKASELSTIRTFADILGIAIAQTNNIIIRDESQRAVHELEMAAEIQHKLLPLPRIDSKRGSEVFAARKSAQEVAGDYLDACYNRTGDLILITVDVMGKGFGSALLAAMTRTAFHLNATGTKSLKKLITSLNETVCQQVGDLNMFATCSIARISKDLSKIEIVNAGHCAPLLFKGNEMVSQVEPSGPPLGLFPDAKYDTETFELTKVNKLLMVTDGLFEWRYDGGIWGWKNFLRFLKNQDTLNPQGIWDNLQEEISKHNPEDKVLDDQTFLFWQLKR